jgi:hypothetical protein
LFHFVSIAKVGDRSDQVYVAKDLDFMPYLPLNFYINAPVRECTVQKRFCTFALFQIVSLLQSINPLQIAAAIGIEAPARSKALDFCYTSGPLTGRQSQKPDRHRLLGNGGAQGARV